MSNNIPGLHGNWIDLSIALIILFYLWSGFSRGLILGLIDLGGFLFSFIASLKLYSLTGLLLIVNFSLPRGIANALGFLLSGILAEILFSTIIHFFFRLLYPDLLIWLRQRRIYFYFHKFDRYLGFIPALGEAFIFTAFILTLLVTLPIQGRVKKDIISSKIGGPLVAKTQGIERQLNQIFGEAVSETLTFITINPNPASGDKIDLGFQQSEGKIDEAAENTMLTLINKERQNADFQPLLVNIKLRELSRKYAADMFTRGFFSHYNPEGESPFDRMRKAGITFQAAGENLALAPNVTLAHQGLMNSPGHRANIMSSDFRQIGIGVIDGGIYGEMFVQEFTD